MPFPAGLAPTCPRAGGGDAVAELGKGRCGARRGSSGSARPHRCLFNNLTTGEVEEQSPSEVEEQSPGRDQGQSPGGDQGQSPGGAEGEEVEALALGPPIRAASDSPASPASGGSDVYRRAQREVRENWLSGSVGDPGLAVENHDEGTDRMLAAQLVAPRPRSRR